MNLTYLPFLLIDAAVLLSCCLVLFSKRLICMLHPSFVYLLFHLFCVSFRLLLLLRGGRPMPNMPGVMSSDEICRAALLADLALVAMTTGWVYAARRVRRSLRKSPTPALPLLPPGAVVAAAVVTGIIGIVGLHYFGFAAHIAGAKLGEYNPSSYFFITTSWAVQAVLMLHFVFGFPEWLVAITSLVLFVTMYNTSRFTVVLGGLFLILTYASRTNRRWPTLTLTIFGAAIVSLYFPMKTIASSIRNGDEAAVVVDKAIGVYETGARDERAAEVAFLDMAACVMTLSDEYGGRFWARPWLMILEAPIPRQVWPDKPPLNEYLYTLQTAERPMATMGMTPLIFGDAYLNFGIVGVVLWPLIVGYFMGSLFHKAMLRGHFTAHRLVYLVLLTTSLQLYRDCLAQAVLFPTTDYLPLLMVALVSAGFSHRRTLALSHSLSRPVSPRLPVNRAVPCQRG
jgi:hypothetical protein